MRRSFAIPASERRILLLQTGFTLENITQASALLKYNGFIYEGALREKSAGERSDKCRGRP